MDIRVKTKNSLYWNVLPKVLYEGFRFGISIVLARLLEPKDFGIASIAFMLIYYSNSITNFGLNQALVNRKNITEKHINSVFTVDLTISIIMVGLFNILASHIGSFFNSPESENVIRIISLIFVLTTFNDLPYTLLRRDVNFKVIAIVDMTNEISISLITIILAFFGFTYWSLVYGRLIPLCFLAFYLIIKARWTPKIVFHYSSLKELLNFGMWSFVRSQVYFFSTRIDRIMVGRYFSPNILGLFDRAKSLSQMPVESIGTNVNTVLFSYFSRIQESSNEDLKLILKKYLMLISLLFFPLYLGLNAIAHQFVIVLFGSKWNTSIVPFQILCISGIFIALNGLLGTFAVCTGHIRRYSIQELIATCFLIIISLIAVKWGLESIAYGVVLYSLLLFGLTLKLLQNVIFFSFRDLLDSVMPALLASNVMFLGLKIISPVLFLQMNLINLSMRILVGIVLYLFVVFLYPSDMLSNIKLTVKQEINNIWLKF